MTNDRIAHVNIRIRDLPASLRFYTALGLELVGCLNAAPGFSLLFFAAGKEDQVTLEMSVNLNADASWDTTPGAGHFALGLESLHERLDILKAAGYEPEGPPVMSKGPHPAWIAFIRDPDGYRIELIDGMFPTPRDPIPDDINALAGGTLAFRR